MKQHVKIGFTGTRHGMTPDQKTEVMHLLRELEPMMVHHGDCVGADYDFDKMAKFLSISRTKHPPSISTYRANCDTEHRTLPKSYLERNKDIVSACDILIATPRENQEIIRSGTWATVRQARREKREIIIIFPSGTKRREP